MLNKGRLGAGLLSSLLIFSVALHAELREPELTSISCQCDASVDYNPALPASHPANLCAVGAHQNTTWLGWLQGKSRSTEFHFLDLLELIWQPSSNSSRNAPQPSNT